MRSRSEDPFLSFRYRIQISGEKIKDLDEDTTPLKDLAGFNEVSGLTFETKTESFREGGFNEHERQLLGPTVSSAKLVLKNGLSGDMLWQWYKQVIAGKLVRKNQLTITLLDNAGLRVPEWEWVFMKVCPVKWTGPQFRAGTAEVAFESIELIHKGLKP